MPASLAFVITDHAREPEAVAAHDRSGFGTIGRVRRARVSVRVKNIPVGCVYVRSSRYEKRKTSCRIEHKLIG